MKPALIVYATREGHTRYVAERIAAVVRAHDVAPDIKDAQDIEEPIDVLGYSAAVIAASVHAGKHEPEIKRFVDQYRGELEAIPTAFISVSLTEAGAEDKNRSADERAEAAREVARMMDEFFEATNWHPDRAQGVAGALMYSKYNLFIRWIMKRIVAKEGGSTDTSHDCVYTDWAALDQFADDFLASVRSPQPKATAADSHRAATGGR